METNNSWAAALDNCHNIDMQNNASELGAQQGAEGTKPRGRGFAPHRRRWKRKRKWDSRSPPLPRVIARQADRAVGEQGKESSEWRGRQIGKWWRLEALVGAGFGEEKRKHSDSNKALKVQIPADGVLTLIADVGIE